MARERKPRQEHAAAGTGGLRYVGGGRYIAGVPARDLSAEEVERFLEALESPLYERAGKTKRGKPLPQGEFLPEADEE